MSWLCGNIECWLCRHLNEKSKNTSDFDPHKEVIDLEKELNKKYENNGFLIKIGVYHDPLPPRYKRSSFFEKDLDF